MYQCMTCERTSQRDGRCDGLNHVLQRDAEVLTPSRKPVLFPSALGMYLHPPLPPCIGQLCLQLRCITNNLQTQRFTSTSTSFSLMLHFSSSRSNAVVLPACDQVWVWSSFFSHLSTQTEKQSSNQNHTVLRVEGGNTKESHRENVQYLLKPLLGYGK